MKMPRYGYGLLVAVLLLGGQANGQMRGGGFGPRGGGGFQGGRGGFHGGGFAQPRPSRSPAFWGGRTMWHGGGDFGWRRHSSFSFNFAFGLPWCAYPVYYYDYRGYPYRYDYPYPYPYSYTYGYSVGYSSPSYAYADDRSYLRLGHDWAKDLRLDIVTWDQFVNYVRAYIVTAPAGPVDDFRRGFLAGYGENARAAFDKAMDQARAAAPNAPPPGPATPGRSSGSYENAPQTGK